MTRRGSAPAARLRSAAAGAALAALALLDMGCSQRPPEAAPRPEEPPIFADRSNEAGLDFVHLNGACGRLYQAEIMGSGAALFDFDNDGDLDVYLVQGGVLDADPECRPPAESPDSTLPLTDRLYRNDLDEGPGGRVLRFTDVTEESGLDASGYGMGVATGDFDNDGWVDLYVTNFGRNQLLRNNGDGTFQDVTSAAGVDDPRWNTSAAFVDFDGDGWLDLYVASYVNFTIAGRQHCRSLTGARDYCGPLTYQPLPDRFFRNRGDGSFDARTWSSALADHPGAGLGVSSGDFDGDGRLDIYVANDGMPNFLWTAGENGVPENRGMLSGSALNREGQAEAGMGVAVADIDGDGDEDVLVTHLALETNTLYRNLGGGIFEDQSAQSGLGSTSWSFTGFGTSWLDFDNDGLQDLVAVNGAVKIIPELVTADDPYPLQMTNQLFRNLDGNRFEEVSKRAGAAFSRLEVSRGVAVGDVDNDGDADVLVANNGGPARLLINERGQERNWVGVRLLDGAGRRDLLGAWVEVESADDGSQFRRVRTDGSYLSAGDPRVLVGLPGDADQARLRVKWPGSDGRLETFLVPAGSYREVIQATGEGVEDAG